ncbi:hypothetical protein GCM10022236_42180 [Microlunatus ginsengisoli]|uniref:IrrE N-terminal-like domain-containing protein n=2 Tax=Microlunatus ginsengisoli TaxID=363863 RepID=A0ABP7AKZ5_9ACTN
MAAGRRRRPKGSPVGGQFAEEIGDESRTELDAADVTAHGADAVGSDVRPACGRCGRPGGVHDCGSPADDPSTAFRYTSVNRKLRAERLEADLTEAIEQVVSSGRLQAWLDRVAQNRMPRWSFGNQLLALWQIEGRRKQLAAESGTPVGELPPIMVMTAAAWDREFGRHPKGGESAIWINGPRTRRVILTDPDTGEEQEDRRLVGITPVAEFDITQTEGPDVPDVRIAVMTDGKVRPGAYSGLKNRIENCGYRLVEAETATVDPRRGGGAYGWADPATRTVQVDPRLTTAQKVETMAHELAHILHGHTDDPARYRWHRGEMETEAEASAYMIRRWLGADDDTADHDSFSPGYIAGWSGGNVARVKTSLTKATKVFQEVIDGDWPASD